MDTSSSVSLTQLSLAERRKVKRQIVTYSCWWKTVNLNDDDDSLFIYIIIYFTERRIKFMVIVIINSVTYGLQFLKKRIISQLHYIGAYKTVFMSFA